MNFLVILGPVLIYLLNKYKNTITLELQESEALNKLNNAEILDPISSKFCIQILVKIRADLIANNISTRLLALKKMIGDGEKTKGFLNLLVEQGHSIYLYLFQPPIIKEQLRSKLNSAFSENFTDLRIISPLNLDDYNEICNFFHNEMKLPIYPLMSTVITSKLLLNLFFTPFVPRCFYFPEITHAMDYIEKIRDICNKEKLKCFILKDEFDVDLQSAIPYQITVAEVIDRAVYLFYEKVQGIVNYGGLLIQELITSDKTINIIKTQIYRKVIPGLQLQEKVVLKSFSDGGFYESLIDNVKFTTVDMSHKFAETFNSILEKYYNNLYSNFDTIYSNNQFYVIDMNSVANNFTLARIPPIIDPDHSHKFFISQIAILNNEDEIGSQIKSRKQIAEFYFAIRQLGPVYFSTDKFITLIDGKEYNIKEFILSHFQESSKDLPIMINTPSDDHNKTEFQPTTNPSS